MDEPIYEQFDTAEGFHAAVDRLLEQPGRELRVFDPDGSALRLNDSARIAALPVRPSDVAQRYYPFLPVSLMLRHRFDSFDLAPRITTPLLRLIAARDEVIPPAHGERLCEAWGGPKNKVVLQEASHNTTDAHPLFWTSIREFLAQKVN